MYFRQKKELTSDFQIAISLQPDGVNLWYFKLRLFDQKWFIVWNSPTLKCKDIGIRKLEFVTKA